MLMQQTQWPEQDLPRESIPLRSAIVLGGGLTVSPAGTPELGRDGERIFSAAQLWHAGLVSSIICTGKTPDGRYNPSDIGEELLLSAGVPPEAVFKVAGETTTGEMQHLQEFLKSPPEGFPSSGELVLITSAFHMPRAMRLAANHDLRFIPYPCAFRGTDFEFMLPSRMIPGGQAVHECSLALKEHLGRLMGR